MADRKLDYQIGVDASKGITGVKQFSSTVKKELKSIEGDFDDTATAGQKVATVLSKMATELDTELDRAAQAAEALSQALGPDLASRADVGSIVGDLQRMGLSFEEIVTDADKLATSLKELDQVQVKGLDAGLGGVNTKMGTLERSAGGSRSVLANMVGNATQDLGALTGVAGSAGVAIGQMGEYMADALGEGEKMGSVLANFGKVAGPVAAISGSLFVMEGIMSSIAQSKALEAERIKTYQAAVEGAVDSTSALADQLLEIGKIEFKDPTKGLFGGVSDLLPKLATLGISVQEFAQLVTSGEEGVAQFVDDLNEMRDAGDISTDMFVQMKSGLEQYQNTAEDAELIQRRLNDAFVVTNDLAKGAFFNWVLATDPAMLYGDQLVRIGQALDDAQGKVGSAFEFPPDVLRDMEIVAEALGIDLPEVYNLATAAVDEHDAAIQKIIDAQKQHTDGIKAQKDAHKEAQRAAEEAYAEEVTQILGVSDALGDLAGTFEQMSIRQDALASIFDLGNAPLDAAGRIRDIELAIDDLSVVAKELDLSEGINPDNLKADELLDRLDSLRPQIQSKITEAFSTGGEEAALAMAQEYIAKVAEELGISEIEAAELMGLDDVLVKIKLGIEASDVENAKRQLELLTGITGETPWSASIALALDTGTITGPQAQRQIQDLLRQYGVTIPAELVPEVTPHGRRKGQEELDEVANGPDGRGRKAKIDPEVGPESKRKADEDIKTVTDPAKPRVAPIYAQASGLQAAEIALERVARTRTADVYIVVHHPDGSTSGSTGGGTSGGGGGGFGPFSVGPTALAAPVPALTSGGGGYGAMTIPVAAPSQPVVINNVLNAAVVGDPFAVARAMEDGVRRAARLMPRNQ